VPLSPEDVQALVAAFDGADWDEMTVTIDGTRLALSRTGRPPTHADGGSPAPTPTAADGAPGWAPQAAAASEAASGAASGAAPPPAPGGAQGVTPRAAAGASADAALSTRAAGGAPGAAQGGAPSASASEPLGGHRVTAPSVGLFWRSPKPGAPPFVEVGDEVGPDDTVCIVEVMKLMNHVRAGTAGTVRAVHPENGQMVEHGDPLFTIGP
jgi:acetyl-CoA carboxylase biotin carboxyl carrier protein